MIQVSGLNANEPQQTFAAPKTKCESCQRRISSKHPVRSLHQVGWNDHVRSSINSEDAPLAGNAFERVLAAIDKLQPGARH
jgi:hypothetical protein